MTSLLGTGKRLTFFFQCVIRPACAIRTRISCLLRNPTCGKTSGDFPFFVLFRVRSRPASMKLLIRGYVLKKIIWLRNNNRLMLICLVYLQGLTKKRDKSIIIIFVILLCFYATFYTALQIAERSSFAFSPSQGLHSPRLILVCKYFRTDTPNYNGFLGSYTRALLVSQDIGAFSISL